MDTSYVADSLVREKYLKIQGIKNILFVVWSKVWCWKPLIITKEIWGLFQSVKPIIIYFIGMINSTIKMWDIHSGKNFKNSVDNEYNNNLILFIPDVNAFGTGSDDSNFRFFIWGSMERC